MTGSHTSSWPCCSHVFNCGCTSVCWAFTQNHGTHWGLHIFNCHSCTCACQGLYLVEAHKLWLCSWGGGVTEVFTYVFAKIHTSFCGFHKHWYTHRYTHRRTGTHRYIHRHTHTDTQQYSWKLLMLMGTTDSSAAKLQQWSWQNSFNLLVSS